ncbi:hypothetical protein ACVWXO_007152 [Bradyrhizobium sp. LM2.7]
MVVLMGVCLKGRFDSAQTGDRAQLGTHHRHKMFPAFEGFIVGIAVMALHNFPKLPSIDRFEELSKDAIHVLHARPFSVSRQPESIRFTLDLPGMRCGIVNHSRDSPAAGGTSFLSHLLGSRTNTGDGYLMAAEAGAELSGMEFTAAYTIAPAHSTMTRSMAYSYATYYDEDGNELDLPFGPDQTIRLARALQRGRVYCSLHRLPDDVKARLHTISPNVPLVFDRWGIDAYRDRFEVTLHNDGTIRGIGGVRVLDVNGATSVPGLFVAGDNASREKVAGAISGGGNINSAWALSSGVFAGSAAAHVARSTKSRSSELTPLGQAGLRPRGRPKEVDVATARAGVRAEMHPFDKNLFRTGAGLAASSQALEGLWSEVANHGQGGSIALREAAALLATARWSVATAAERNESRGLHRREDYPAQDPRLAARLLSGGLDQVWFALDRPSANAQPGQLQAVS